MCQKVNVYGFGVNLKSAIAAGDQNGSSVAVIAANADQARADLASYIGDDLLSLSGPTIIVEGALCEALPDLPTEPPAEPTGATKHDATKHSSPTTQHKKAS